MEYLVTMTTHVPDGTPEAAVDDIRTREAGRSRELAAQGHLLRLWRPPLQPGEWRTLGLFAAADGAGLERVLASMPLRVWRTDDVTPLSPHPNDPARPTGRPGPPAPAAGAASSSPRSPSPSRRAHPARLPGTPTRARRNAHVNWPGRGTCYGSGRCPAGTAPWASGGSRTLPGCRRSWSRCRCMTG